MPQSNYTLEIISHHPKFNNKSLRKYYVDGIETVGAWGDEPFEVRFTNNTWTKVQVKISIDGTDVLAGSKATTDVTKDMWVVNAHSTLSLKAWPETNNGGAQFIFTNANNSVAVHTHGDLSSRGIVAAAVYTEGHVEPTRIYNNFNTSISGKLKGSAQRSDVYHWETIIGGDGNFTLGDCYNQETITSNTLDSEISDSINFNASNNSDSHDYSRSLKSKELKSLVAVGAGQHVDQKITYVTGLIKPVFTETVRVKYLWWDDLVEKLKENNVPEPHASGFPGDKKRHIMSLGNTPRLGKKSKNAFPREQSQPAYDRV